jgi:hypothetical protein
VEPVVLEGKVVEALAATVVSTEAPLVPLCLARRYFGTFPFNFLITAFTRALTSRFSQYSNTDFAPASSFSFDTIPAWICAGGRSFKKMLRSVGPAIRRYRR